MKGVKGCDIKIREFLYPLPFDISAQCKWVFILSPSVCVCVCVCVCVWMCAYMCVIDCWYFMPSQPQRVISSWNASHQMASKKLKCEYWNTLVIDCCLLGLFMLTVQNVPAGLPSCGGDVTVYFLHINQPSLPTLFILSLCLFLSLWPFQLYFIP